MQDCYKHLEWGDAKECREFCQPQVSAIPTTWIDDLTSKGFTVQRGQYGFFDTNTCAKSDTCYAINPITPYGLFWLPPHPKETTAGNYTNSCHHHNLCRNINGTTFSPSWRIAEGEVIALVGTTPPASTYWSFSNYLYTRYHPEGWRSNASIGRRLVGCKKGPNRCEIFAGINDPLNMQTVNVGERSPYQAPLNLLLTFDHKSEAAVKGAMEASESGAIVNTLRFPGAILNQGVSSGKEDEFLNVLRVEGIQDAAERDAFYADNKYEIYRITPSEDFRVAHSDKFESFNGKMRTRWTGISESVQGAVSNAQLASGLKELKAAVIQTHRHLLDYVSVPFKSFVNDSGYECLEDGSRCQGDCRDTIYAKATLLPQELICNMTHFPCKPSRNSQLTTDPTDALYMVGVNHRMTNQSLYSSLTAYNFPKLASGQLIHNGTKSYTIMETAEALAGSATAYLPDHPAAPFLYVVKVARSCAGSDGLCYELVSKSDGGELVIDPTQPVVFIERMYIHPGTSSGPAVEETILPWMIHFKRSESYWNGIFG